MTDPVGDMIVRIKNASQSKKDTVLVPYSKLKQDIADVLEKEGYVKSLGKKGKKSTKYIELEIVYNAGNSKINGVKRVSKPSRRVYMKSHEIRQVKNGYGLSVVSTPKGVITGQSARKEKVGGEVLFELW